MRRGILSSYAVARFLCLIFQSFTLFFLPVFRFQACSSRPYGIFLYLCLYVFVCLIVASPEKSLLLCRLSGWQCNNKIQPD